MACDLVAIALLSYAVLHGQLAGGSGTRTIDAQLRGQIEGVWGSPHGNATVLHASPGGWADLSAASATACSGWPRVLFLLPGQMRGFTQTQYRLHAAAERAAKGCYAVAACTSDELSSTALDVRAYEATALRDGVVPPSGARELRARDVLRHTRFGPLLAYAVVRRTGTLDRYPDALAFGWHAVWAVARWAAAVAGVAVAEDALVIRLRPDILLEEPFDVARLQAHLHAAYASGGRPRAGSTASPAGGVGVDAAANGTSLRDGCALGRHLVLTMETRAQGDFLLLTSAGAYEADIARPFELALQGVRAAAAAREAHARTGARAAGRAPTGASLELARAESSLAFWWNLAITNAWGYGRSVSNRQPWPGLAHLQAHCACAEQLSGACPEGARAHPARADRPPSCLLVALERDLAAGHGALLRPQHVCRLSGGARGLAADASRFAAQRARDVGSLLRWYCPMTAELLAGRDELRTRPVLNVVLGPLPGTGYLRRGWYREDAFWGTAGGDGILLGDAPIELGAPSPGRATAAARGAAAAVRAGGQRALLERCEGAGAAAAGTRAHRLARSARRAPRVVRGTPRAAVPARLLQASGQLRRDAPCLRSLGAAAFEPAPLDTGALGDPRAHLLPCPSVACTALHGDFDELVSRSQLAASKPGARRGVPLVLPLKLRRKDRIGTGGELKAYEPCANLSTLPLEKGGRVEDYFTQ